jgi:peroxiredoxin
MRRLILFMALLTLGACRDNNEIQGLEKGMYRGVLSLPDNEQLPFTFRVNSPTSLEVYNADEVIEVDEITYRNDSIYIYMPVFESYIAAVFEGENLKGEFINETRNRMSPFSAYYQNDNRFPISNGANKDVTGIWETVFSEGRSGEYKAMGIFEQSNDKVTGTFRTTTGDYRFLEGVIDGDSLKLSAFDGAHAFLFVAKVSDSTINGTFYSGNHWKEPFSAKRNPKYEMPNPEELTDLKENYDRLEFSFPDEYGNMISLSDDRFKNKVVVVMLMGTWCPNCLDGSKYYTEVYNNYKEQDFEMIALAVEFVKTKKQAFSNIKRLRDRIGMEYPIVLAQYGSGSKSRLQEKLPMLNEVVSYPTTIFIDKTGKVRKIHTGFNGPATGGEYTIFTSDFEDFVTMLLEE